MKSRTFLILATVSLVVAAVAVATYHTEPSDFDASRGKLYEVNPVSFHLEVMARGVVRPAKVEPVKSKISSNQAKVVWLYKEGEDVNKGMIIARFDTKPFMDKLMKAQQDLGDAKASHAAAIKALELQKEQEEGKIESAMRKLEIAQLKAEDLKEGSGRLKRRRLQQAVQKAERAYDIVQIELADFELMLKKGHVSQRERGKVANELSGTEESLELARAELTNFDRYERPQVLREAELIIDAEKANLERVRRTSTLEIQRREGEVEKFRRNVESAEKKRKQAVSDVENCDIRAPIDGVLLHVALPKAERRRKTQVGDSIWYGQTFMEIPDTRDMIVEISVREVDVAMLKTGQEADIQLDALPQVQIKGRILSINSLAEENDQAYLRLFHARVQLAEAPENIHVGMSANVRIPFMKLANVLAVPVSAVTYKKGLPYLMLAEGEEIEQRSIETGAVGLEWIEISKGVRSGDKILVQSL